MDNGFWAIPVMFSVIIAGLLIYGYGGYVWRWFLYSGVVFNYVPRPSKETKEKMKKPLDELTKL